MNRVLVIGLDCVSPELVFEKYRKDLPNIDKLISKGLWGRLKSSTPPSSTNAWLSMATGKSSDSIGIYDYVYRINRSYTDLGIINSTLVKDDYIWDILSYHGKRVIVVNVPMTYPPKKVNGLMVTGILTPEKGRSTYPEELKKELDELVGDYKIGIPDPRVVEKKELLEKLYELAKKRFKVIKHLIKNKDWDFFIGVIYSTDAIMHNFWRYVDPDHKKYEPDSGLENSVRDFLVYVDGEIGEILSMIDRETTVILMSDHGAKRMDGRFNINEWLIREGYLSIRKKPKDMINIYKADVDWSKTKIFATGAYYACIYLNVRGRDPEGIVEPEDFEKLKKEIIEKLKKIHNDLGGKMDTRIFEPKIGINAPDLIVYFDDLHWGVNSTIGNDSLYSWATEKGPDDAIHSQEGFFIISKGTEVKSKNMGQKDIRDITPTILKEMGVFIPEELEGKPIE